MPLSKCRLRSKISRSSIRLDERGAASSFSTRRNADRCERACVTVTHNGQPSVQAPCRGVPRILGATRSARAPDSPRTGCCPFHYGELESPRCQVNCLSFGWTSGTLDASVRVDAASRVITTVLLLAVTKSTSQLGILSRLHRVHGDGSTEHRPQRTTLFQCTSLEIRGARVCSDECP